MRVSRPTFIDPLARGLDTEAAAVDADLLGAHRALVQPDLTNHHLARRAQKPPKDALI